MFLSQLEVGDYFQFAPLPGLLIMQNVMVVTSQQSAPGCRAITYASHWKETGDSPQTLTLPAPDWRRVVKIQK